MIPDHLTPENLAAWGKEHSVERNKFTIREDYDDDDIIDMEHRLSDRTIELENILGLKADAVRHFADGTDETTISIPKTIGIKSLKESISNLASKIDLGYSERVLDIYGIPYSSDKQIVFVDIEGNQTGPPRGMNDVEIEKFTGPLFDGVAGTLEKVTDPTFDKPHAIPDDSSAAPEMEEQGEFKVTLGDPTKGSSSKELAPAEDASEPEEIDTEEFPDMDKKIEDDDTF